MSCKSFCDHPLPCKSHLLPSSSHSVEFSSVFLYLRFSTFVSLKICLILFYWRCQTILNTLFSTHCWQFPYHFQSFASLLCLCGMTFLFHFMVFYYVPLVCVSLLYSLLIVNIWFIIHSEPIWKRVPKW